MERPARVFVAGSETFVGRAVAARLAAEPVTLVGLGPDAPDLRDAVAVNRFFETERPDQVFVAAGAHAGIGGNERRPADLIVDNLRVISHVIPAAWHHRAEKLLFLGSSCVYPKHAPQPFHPDSLGTGPVEPTSAAYAQAKIAGLMMTAAYRRQHGARFISVIGADAYGPGDDFSPEDSHVVAALLRRMHEARLAGSPEVTVWGTGAPRREFIYVDDLADACVFAMRHYDAAPPLNLGTGVTTSIRELAEAIRDVVGYEGTLRFDATKPDGMPFKGLDSSQLHALGWRPRWTLRDGLRATYDAWRQPQTD